MDPHPTMPTMRRMSPHWWASSYPEQVSSSWIKGSDTRWRTFRAGVLARDAGLCQIRGSRCTDVATQVDHIQPLVMGGEKYDPSNCRAACQPCNLDRRVTLPRSTATPHSRW